MGDMVDENVQGCATGLACCVVGFLLLVGAWFFLIGSGVVARRLLEWVL